MRTFIRWSGIALLFAVCFEGTARVEDWVRYRTPFLSRFREQGELMVRDHEGAHGRPNARYMKWVMNDLGMRGPAVGATKRPGTLRVIAAGASETFGLYESPNREFPRQLEDSLALLATTEGLCQPGDSVRFEVLNAALPGMSLPTIEQDVRLRLARLDVDMVLLYPTPAQYLASEPPTAAPPDSSGNPTSLPWTRALHPRTAERLREQLKLILPEAIKTWLRRRETAARIRDQPPGWQFEAPPAERVALFERDLRRFVGSVRQIGAIPLLATHGNAFAEPSEDAGALLVMWEKFYPRATGATIVAFDSLARLAVLRVAADSGALHVDVAARVAQRSLYRDFAHFTDEGAARVASAAAPIVAAAARARLACSNDVPPAVPLRTDAQAADVRIQTSGADSGNSKPASAPKQPVHGLP